MYPKQISEVRIKGYHWSQSELEKIGKDQIFYLSLNYTSRCNLRCPYCFVGLYDLNISHNELDLEDKKRIIYEAKNVGAKVLVIPGRGEPLLDKDFWEILEFANDIGFWVIVYTNGYYLNKENIQKLKNSKISLYIKVDSFKSDIYDELVGVKGAYIKFEKSLEYLLDYFHEPEIINGKVITRLGFNSVVTKQSVNSISEIYEYCKINNIYYTCRSPVKVGQADKTWYYLVGNEIENLRNIGNKYAARNFTSATEKGQCGIYRFGLTIENNGDIYVCPDARENFKPIGNVIKKSLTELIRVRNEKYPLNSESGYCFVKRQRNPEEKQ